MTPITVNGRLVYGVCVETARGLRVRLAAAEAEWLGLFEGQMVQVGVRGQSPAAHHILSLVTITGPGWTWAELAVAPSRLAVGA